MEGISSVDELPDFGRGKRGTQKKTAASGRRFQ